MANSGAKTGFDRAIHMLCVVALVLLGLAHRPPTSSASTLTASEIAALTLPDGTLPELCLPSDEAGGKSKSHLSAADCEACRISATVLLPTPGDVTGIRLPRAVAIVLPAPAEAHYRQLFPPNSAPRAPPALT